MSMSSICGCCHSRQQPAILWSPLIARTKVAPHATSDI
jgi:hypothetical protein